MTFTPTNYVKFEISFFEFLVLAYIEISELSDCPERATVVPSHMDVHGKTTNFKMSYLMTHICYPFTIWRS